MSKLFSSRYKYVPDKIMQIDDIDNELRNRLWRFLGDNLLGTSYRLNYEISDRILKRDESIGFGELKTVFLTIEWYKVYDIIEAAMNINKNDSITFLEGSLNNILAEENAGYRSINCLITPIANQHECDEIKEALSNADKYGFSGAVMHVETALKHLSNRQHKDYRNITKESVSALESLLCKLAKIDNPSGLKGAKKTLSGVIPPTLFTSMEQLFSYASSPESGARHAVVDDNTHIDFEEAKLLLVTCSAYINYILMKAEKNGMLKTE